MKPDSGARGAAFMSKIVKTGRTPTSEDVARLAGVSRSAVSRTFTDGASVSPKTREKVMRAADVLGYRVNFLARSLSQQRTRLIGLVVSDMDHSLRGSLVDRLARGLVALDYRPFLLPTNPGDDVGHLIDMMLHYNVSGAIVTSDTPPSQIADACVAHDVPLVLVNKAEVGGKVINVSMDSRKAGRMGAEVLYDAGCRSVAIASQRRASHTIGLRKKAFTAACADLGIEIVGDFQGAIQDYAGGVEAAEAFLASGLAPDAAYCVNDYLALGFLDHIRYTAHMDVPGDLKVAACDDIAEAGWQSYDLTTVRQDPSAIAGAAITALINRIDDPDLPVPPIFIDVALVERNSTRAAPSSL
ncbi:LacI family DNA-binding transcriptional regulator [Pelagibacterium xiamenense]|uniref:LacI family DNA-binding transcriptional regulator n=1 Tax=Pelagibacterium xiamenense TaxID=2901140 RepID=UPI001E406E41|nr:LacI family DNA-binding transcriptional regulator [Pelagibacterium xiamenense]MCD7060583.1 LacI family DNA-binding transcriptional regulator [Pelagibacterium xiamenense]